MSKVDPVLAEKMESSGPDVSNASDVLSRYITQNTTKDFVEIFHK